MTRMNTDLRHVHLTRGQRGIVLIMVVVVIVLMAVLGAAYLTRIRMDRLSNRGFRDNTEIVADALISHIKLELARDIMDDADRAFHEASGDEPYDFPHTGTTPGTLDDIWLASWLPSGANWKQVTNLSDEDSGTVTPWGFLKDVGVAAATAPTVDGTLTALNLPIVAVSGSGPNSTQVDTDGDGIYDARWTWSPLKTVGGVEYVVAVRIIDNGGLVNLNVWTDIGSGTGASDGHPRFYYPTDLNLSLVMENAPFNLGSPPTQAVNWINFRTTGFSVASPLTHLAREQFWFFGPKVGFGGDTPAQAGTAANEIELRHRNGLNREITTQVESSGFATLFRDSAAETVFTDFNSDAATFLNTEPRRQTTVMSGTGPLAGRQSVPVTATDKAVKLLTLFAYSVDDLAELLQDEDMPFEADVPVANVPFGDHAIAAAQLAACFRDYFDVDNQPSSGLGAYRPGDGLPDSRGDDGGSNNTDIESQITKVTTPATRYGMEALPFLTEAYVQAAYELTGATEEPAASQMYDLTWTKKGRVGFAVEMVNPWGSAVRNLHNVRLVVKAGSNTVVEKTLWELLQIDEVNIVPTDPNKHEEKLLEPGAGLIFTQTNNLADVPTGVMSWASATPANWHRIDLGEPGSSPGLGLSNTAIATGQDLVFELQVEVDGGGEWITYSRIQKTKSQLTGADERYALHIPGTVTVKNQGPYNTAPVTGDVNHDRFIQRSAFCVPAGLAPTSVICSSDDTTNEFDHQSRFAVADDGMGTWHPQFAGPPSPDPTVDAATDKIPLNGYEALADSPKSVDGVSPNVKAPWDAATHTASAASYRFDDVDARYATDIYRVMWVGPTATKTYAEVLRNAGLTGSPGDSLKDRMLNITVGENLAGTGNRAYNRSWLLLDRITGIPSVGGSLLGRPNINATTTGTLTNAIPIDGLAGAIASDLIGLKGTTGTASMGRLFELTNATTWGGDSSLNLTQGALQVAFTGGGAKIKADPGSSGLYFGDLNDDGVVSTDEARDMFVMRTDGREEEVRLVGFLSNLVATRSDYFTAYFVIQGYQPGAWDTPVEFARFLAVFDRTGVAKTGHRATLAAIYRLN